MMITLILIVFYLILVIVFFYVWELSYTVQLMSKIPGPKGWPIIGNIFGVVMSADKLFLFARYLRKNFGPINKLQGFNYRFINIYEPADVEIILSSIRFNEKQQPYTFLRPWLCEGLLISNGEKWFQRRKLLTPAFHFNILRQFSRTFIEQTEVLLEKLSEEIGKDKTSIVPLIARATLHIMCETSMGTSMNEGILAVANKYFHGIHLVGNCVVGRVVRLWLYLDWIFNLTNKSREQKRIVDDLHSFTNNIIQERKLYREVNNLKGFGISDVYGRKSRLAMLDMLLENEKQGKIDIDGIREEVDTFLFEGHDTTSVALSFMIMRIANEPIIQEKIYEEQYRIFGSSQQPSTVEQLSEMKYLECCIKESLRLYPSVPFIARKITEEVTFSGYKIPADTMCHIHIFDMHHGADNFPEPERFVPERFLPENVAKRHPYSYIPFSAGPRNCIGQKFAMLEMKTVMSGLLRRFRLEPVTKPEDLVFTCDLVLRSVNPIYVRICQRETQS